MYLLMGRDLLVTIISGSISVICMQAKNIANPCGQESQAISFVMVLLNLVLSCFWGSLCLKHPKAYG